VRVVTSTATASLHEATGGCAHSVMQLAGKYEGLAVRRGDGNPAVWRLWLRRLRLWPDVRPIWVRNDREDTAGPFEESALGHLAQAILTEQLPRNAPGLERAPTRGLTIFLYYAADLEDKGCR